VIVNTVVCVQAAFDLDNQATALALAAFGGGSMVAALALPKLLETVPDRTAMLAGASLLAADADGCGASRLWLAAAALVPARYRLLDGASAIGTAAQRSANPKIARRCSQRSLRFPMPAG
jgi:hypothetical protein